MVFAEGQMSDKPSHFEEQGPGRDYDCTTFCKSHGKEAISAAEEWLLEAADDADVGFSAGIYFHHREGADVRCYVCDPEDRT